MYLEICMSDSCLQYVVEYLLRILNAVFDEHMFDVVLLGLELFSCRCRCEAERRFRLMPISRRHCALHNISDLMEGRLKRLLGWLACVKFSSGSGVCPQLSTKR